MQVYTIPDADQMCYVCQFATSLPVECATDPKAWKGGDPFVRCSQDCTIDAIFDAGNMEFASA